MSPFDLQAPGRKARERSPDAYSGRKRSLDRHNEAQPSADSWREDEGVWPNKRRAGANAEPLYNGRPDTRKSIPCTFFNTPRVRLLFCFVLFCFVCFDRAET